MKDGCVAHPSFLEVYYEKDHMGVAVEIGILCAKCGTKKRVWPEKPRQYYCRFCGHHAPTKPRDAWGCPKCGTSVPMKEA